MNDRRPRSRAAVPLFIIGVGLGGFFDGILLHQVLQWHHLLSLVPGETFRDLETQILADGLFHVLMYVVTAYGLWLLWRRRQDLGQAGARWVAGVGLLGFAVWNVIDVGFFHWILGIHRIRVDVPDPLLWDLGWLLVFGLVPGAIAWMLMRQGQGGDAGRAAGMTVALLALLTAPLAALPQPNSESAVVVFAPGVSSGNAVDAVLAAGGRIIWTTSDARTMAVALDQERSTVPLYARGALLVTRSPAVAGCLAALRA